MIHFVGTCQGDSLGGSIFAFVHFQTLCCSIGLSPSYFFPSKANDTYIIGLTYDVFHAFDHFTSQFCLLRLMFQHHKCTISSPSSLPFNFSPHEGCYTPLDGIPFSSPSFTSSFLHDALHNNVYHIKPFSKLVFEVSRGSLSLLA